jgi:hypothetical protein
MCRTLKSTDSDIPRANAWFDRLTTLSNVERAKRAKFGSELLMILQTILIIRFPTFAALASLRGIIRVLVASSPRWVFRGE